MNNVDRSLTLSPDAATLWVHWGRTGGGPRFLADVVDGDLAGGDAPATFLSFNPDAEISPRFAVVSASGTVATPAGATGSPGTVPAFPVPTYNSAPGVILGLPRLLWNSVRLHRWIRAHNVQRVVCVMESVYQSLALPLLIPSDVEYVACIHDGSAHPGEGNIVQTIGRRNELRRADRVVTFSQAVTDILADQVTVPISTGSHPPFDLQDAATEPRELPGADSADSADSAVPVVGIFGRLQAYKGIDVALEAMRILRGRGAPECELHIIGSGPEERWRETDLGTEAVWDNRWIPESEVTDVVRGIDIMLLPYTEASQSGPVTLALAHAVPCVATPVGAIPDQVEGFGVVTDDISPEAVADGIQALLEDPERYRELSAGAVTRVSKQPNWSDLATLVREGQVEDGAAASAAGSAAEPGTTAARRAVTQAKWAGQRVFGLVNTHLPLPDAPETGGRTRVVLPASHGSFGDEAMGLVAAECLHRRGVGVDLVVPGDAEPWRGEVPADVEVVPLSEITTGPGATPTPATVAALTAGPLIVIGADTLAGDYELSLLAMRVRMLNVAAKAGQPAALVNFSLPEKIHPDARRILRTLAPEVQVRARDPLSAQRAEKVLGREVGCTPDIAALLAPAETEDSADSAGSAGSAGSVALVPNAHLAGMYDTGTDQLVEWWRDIAVALDRPVEVVVHDIRESVGDIVQGERITAALEEAGVDVALTVPRTAAEAKAALSRASLCVSARMHACVAALSSGVPTVGIGYVGKFSGQFSWYGDLGTVLEYRAGLEAAEVVRAAQELQDAHCGPNAADAAAADADGAAVTDLVTREVIGEGTVTDQIRRDYAELLDSAASDTETVKAAEDTGAEAANAS
ncbi:MAG TPA: glycosyltransferase [Candidatus Corynebacterium avicola]|uniref:Glycosyltransferase n=1 Tax=Candidatus Corynebacterium avicola TaxID=2838527 RepID=A0A9D1RNX8_9CORY|nr:glycosyltransferase [Candidatus Corynebacterium avicola]